jgi:hypothetical protein
VTTVQSTFLVDHAEQRFLLEDAFGLAEEQVSTRVEGVMKHRQQPCLQLALKINQDITATDQIQAKKGRVLHQILTGEDHHVAEVLVDLVAVTVRCEVGTQAGAVHVCQAGRGKNTAPRQRHGIQVNVGGENLQPILVERGTQTFGKQDRQRIRLLAGGAAGDPDADVVTWLLVGENVGHDFVEPKKSLGIAKKGGDRDQNVFAQLVEFDRRLVDHLQVIEQRADVVGSHAPLDAPPQGRLLVLREIHLGTGANLAEQRFQRRRGARRLCGDRNQAAVENDQADLGAHVFGW